MPILATLRPEPNPRFDGKQRCCRLKAAFNDPQLKCLVLDAYWWSREAQARRCTWICPMLCAFPCAPAALFCLALLVIGGVGRYTCADSSECACRPLRLLPPHPALPRHLCSPHLRHSVASLLQEACRELSCRCRPADIYAGWDTRQEWAAAPARSDSSGSTVAGCTLHPQTYARAVRHYAHLLQARGQGQGGWRAPLWLLA